MAVSVRGSHQAGTATSHGSSWHWPLEAGQSNVLQPFAAWFTARSDATHFKKFDLASLQWFTTIQNTTVYWNLNRFHMIPFWLVGDLSLNSGENKLWAHDFKITQWLELYTFHRLPVSPVPFLCGRLWMHHVGSPAGATQADLARVANIFKAPVSASYGVSAAKTPRYTKFVRDNRTCLKKSPWGTVILWKSM